MSERTAKLCGIETNPSDLLLQMIAETTEPILGVNREPVPFTSKGDKGEELAI